MSGADESLIADHPEIPPELALQGFEGVRAYRRGRTRSAALLEQACSAPARWRRRLGAARRAPRRHDRATTRRRPSAAARAPAPSTTWPGARRVAEHPRWRDPASAGVRNSGIIDRHYFHSIYFREPSGVLFEIADDGPGFTGDVPLEELGSSVILPPWLEPHREEIEAALTPLPDPRAAWAPTP